MFERFTDASRRAVVLAQESAVELGHRRITAEHLMLGIARAEHGAGAAVLTEHGATADRLRDAVREVVPADPEIDLTSHVPFTPAAKKALELSLRESLRLNANAIDTGHILLALLDHGGDELAAVFAAAGVDPVALRSATEQWLAAAPAGAPRRLTTPLGIGRPDRIEALLTEVLARLDRIEARLDQLEG